MTFPIPDKALSSHTAVLGMTGSGKTTTAKLIIEHVVAEKARVCILDPIKSDWWGITSSASGKSPGLPFQILGGPRGHVPLHAAAGKAVGELVARGSLPLSVIDMADFEPGGLQRFFTDFAQTLMKRMRGVLYLVLEEAHEFAPKERAGIGNENLAIHYAKKLAVAGRTKGLRLLVLTQRTQSLHNALLGSCETMIAHRFMSPADQDPVLDWLKRRVKDKAEKEAIALSLSELVDGEAWVISGAAKMLTRLKFPRPWTYDNTKTPDQDDDDHQVKMAAVDVEGLREAIGEAVKEAEANDPVKLRGRIAELERKLQAAAHVKAMDPLAIEAAETRGLERGLAGARESQAALLAALRMKRHELSSGVEQAFEEILDALAPVEPTAPPPVKNFTRYNTSSAPPRIVPKLSHGNRGAGEKLPKAERSILTALAQYPDGRTKVQVAVLTGYAHSGGGFNNALSALRRESYIAEHGPKMLITPAGEKALGAFDPLPSGQDLLQHWLRQLGKAERAALIALVNAYPKDMAKELVAAEAGYEAEGGGFNNALSRLRTLELVTGNRGVLRASDNLFDG